jgi:hypothetical protein
MKIGEGFKFKDKQMGMTMVVIGKEGGEYLANSQIELDLAYITEDPAPVPVYRYPQARLRVVSQSAAVPVLWG